MNYSQYLKTFDAQKIFLNKDLVKAPKAIIIIVHGLDEHQGRYDYLTGCLNQADFSVYRFDNRGHGRSDGAQTYIDDFNTFLEDTKSVYDLAAEENPELPIFMLGHSMGGFISAAFGVKYSDKLEGQILTGAATNEIEAFAELKELSLAENPDMKLPNELGNLVSKSNYVVDAYEKDPYVSEFTTLKLMKVLLEEGIPWLVDNLANYKYPVLILHGADDQIVDPECSEKLYNLIASEDKEKKIYPGLYHEILNSAEKGEIIRKIIDWIEARI